MTIPPSNPIPEHIWSLIRLPPSALSSLTLPSAPRSFPSSFKIDLLAQSTIALSALAASLIHSRRCNLQSVPPVSVSARHAALEFVSERLYTLDGKPPASSWGVIGGLYKTKGNGYVRIHDSFINHRIAALRVLGFPEQRALNANVSRDEVKKEIAKWDAEELENKAQRDGAVMVKLRSYEEWDATAQGKAVSDMPVRLRRCHGNHESEAKISNFRANTEQQTSNLQDLDADRPLRSLRVLELSRVIAAPVAGRTLAAHGADVLWLTAPHLPSLPDLDTDLSRGKRTIQLDYRNEADKARILDLVRDADVVIQSYRPGSLEAHGLGVDDLLKVNPGLIYASLSAYGGGKDESEDNREMSPWFTHRGFDSQVQTCSGMNVSEAGHFSAGNGGTGTGKGSSSTDIPARPMPCQALDHAAGYLLATGIMAAVYQRDFGSGGAGHYGGYTVDVSLAGVMKYLRSLGQLPGASGFECEVPLPKEVPGTLGLRHRDDKDEDLEQYFESRECEFGLFKGVRHAGVIEGCRTGWDVMPKRLGTDRAEWIGWRS